MKTVFKTFISTFIIAFFISFALLIIDKIFNQIYNPKDVFFVGFIFWIFILIVGLIMDVLDKDDSKSNHFYMPPPPITKDNIKTSVVYEKQRKKEENIRLNLTLAYLNYTKNSIPPLQDETEIIEKFYQYVKEGQKDKKRIQDEI